MQSGDDPRLERALTGRGYLAVGEQVAALAALKGGADQDVVAISAAPHGLSLREPAGQPGGQATLGQIVRDVSGLPLDRYLRGRVFGPLGMESSDLVRSERVRPRLATGYALRSGGLRQVTDYEVVPVGAGSVCSTTSDMTRYVSALPGLEGPVRLVLHRSRCAHRPTVQGDARGRRRGRRPSGPPHDPRTDAGACGAQRSASVPRRRRPLRLPDRPLGARAGHLACRVQARTRRRGERLTGRRTAR
jgi:CubicO group peptidase (beta-lactamase class C family)